MALITLNTVKPGDVAPRFALNTDKGSFFRIRLRWNGKADLDLHALVTTMPDTYPTTRPVVNSLDDILSTYNVKRVIRGQQQGHLVTAADGTFSIHGGALVHSPDAQDGSADDDDEFVDMYPDRLIPPPGGAIQIPLVAMVHPSAAAKFFRDVDSPRLVVEDGAGAVLLNVELKEKFGDFNGVQAGSIMVTAARSEFVAVGVGFTGSFNDVLANFA